MIELAEASHQLLEEIADAHLLDRPSADDSDDSDAYGSTMRRSATDVALARLTQTGRARIRVMTRDHRGTETRLRDRAAAISKPYARLRIDRVEDGKGYLDVDLLLDEPD